MKKIYPVFFASCFLITTANGQSIFESSSNKEKGVETTSLVKRKGIVITPSRSLMDADMDGVPDATDVDDDNDGIPDVVECGGVSGGFINGDFELPAGFASGNRYLEEQDLPGWLTTSSDDSLELWYNGFNSVPTQSGDYLLELNANGNATLYQELYLPPGTMINWSLYHRGRNGADTAVVKIGPSIPGLLFQDSLKNDQTAWNAHSGSYTIPGGQTMTLFAIESGGTFGTNLIEGNLLDNIQVSISSVGLCNTDEDAMSNAMDIDSDNDGIPDIVEAGGVDTDGDGRVDYQTPGDPLTMTDLDGDGLMDAYDVEDTGGPTPGWTAGIAIGYPDSDGDGIANVLDRDSDQDGIPDIVEAGGVDTNGDGKVDDSTDADMDGFANSVDPLNENNPGTNEGTALIITGGDGGSGIPTVACVDCDTDLDGLPDYIDIDADNDGIPDLVEVGGIDADGNGNVDSYSDIDADGLVDVYDENADDGPGGVGTNGLALVETSAAGILLSGDKATDSLNFDSDNFVDYLDIDADNDGIPDLVESGATDADDDGKVDTAIVGWDADNDGLADVYDESVPTGMALIKTTDDINDNQRVNVFVEEIISGNGGIINPDGDTQVNHLDLDADNDGIVDVVENAGGNPAADDIFGNIRNGMVINFTDIIADGWNDSSTSSVLDSDGDQVPDYRDSDADNDGIYDYIEGVCTTCPTAGGPAGSDDDLDGILNIYELLNDVNLVGIQSGVNPTNDNSSPNAVPDYLDTDTDGDTANDWTEGFNLDGDGEVVDEYITIADNYESMNGFGHYLSGDDMDLDGIPDFADNQINTGGYIEANRPPFLEYGSGYWYDADGDGLADLFDFTEQGTSAPLPDENGSSDKDWRDATQGFFLPVTLETFTAERNNCFTQLQWTTSSEEDFNHFEIEWSNTGNYFVNVGSAQAAGQGVEQYYEMLHKNTAAENYYRLKMVDVNGEEIYSPVIQVTHECNLGYAVQLFPNPLAVTNEGINIKFYSELETATATLYDMMGRKLRQYDLLVNLEWNLMHLDVSNLAGGAYYFKLGAFREAIPFMVME